MLSEKELNEIREEAERCLPPMKFLFGAPPGADMNEMPRHVFIEVMKAERQRSKVLVEALEIGIKESKMGIVHTSGKYLESVAAQALDTYKNYNP